MPTLRRRFFGPRPADEPTESLWMHAVSVGETGVAAVLAQRLPASGRLCFTTVTPTGQRAAARALGERIDLAYLPFDLFWAVYRFLAWARPRAAVLVEGDYWPFLLSTLRRRRVPVYVVNGRLSDRSFDRLKLLPRALTRAWFRPITRFGVQSEQERERFLALGLDADRVVVTGNMKFDQRPPTRHPGLEERLRELADGRPILVAGSTMQSEDEKVLQAFDELAGEAMLLLAPRHPERSPAVRDLAVKHGFRVAMRSNLQAPPLRSPNDGRGRPDVVILDTIGELAGLYRLAACAFIGGTLVDTGGHNPLEPAAHAAPIVAGPSMHNFRAIAREFDRARAWRLVNDATELADVWRDCLADPESAAGYGHRARQLLEDNRGAVDTTFEFLQPLIDRWQNGQDDA